MRRLIVTVAVYLDPDETPAGLVDRITRGLERALGRDRLVTVRTQVDTVAEAMNPGDYTPA